MNLLRRCRVNAALTIQLFSQLFHYVNMWLFNVLVTEKRMQFCTRSWGMRLKRRLGRVEAWAEKQGLELAADCHLCRIIQVSQVRKFSSTVFVPWYQSMGLLTQITFADDTLVYGCSYSNETVKKTLSLQFWLAVIFCCTFEVSHVFYARSHPIKFAVISNSVLEIYFYLSQTSLDLKVSFYENEKNAKNIF